MKFTTLLIATAITAITIPAFGQDTITLKFWDLQRPFIAGLTTGAVKD